MVNNNTLKSRMHELTKLVMEFYGNNTLEKLGEIDKLLSFDQLLDLDSEVQNLPLFSECTKLMNDDQHIKTMIGHLVGTSNTLGTIGSNEDTLSQFFRRFYYGFRFFSQENFDKAYLSFEDLFYSDTIKMTDSARLNNFHSTLSKIEFGNGISLQNQPLSQTEQYEYKTINNWVYLKPYVSDYILEREYTTRKQIDPSDDTLELEQAHLNETSRIFDLVITALKLLKTSAVFRNEKVKCELLTFHPTLKRSYINSFYETVIRGPYCEIDESEILDLKTIYTFIATETDTRFHIAQRRLSLGMERSSLEDRLIDFMIGLEALYLPDGNDELTFKLSLRVAYTLFATSQERQETFYFVKDMYKTRSKIVHGDKYSIENLSISRLEELLRNSLKIWISDNSKFSKENINKVFFT